MDMRGEVSKSGTSIDSKIVLLGKTLISFSISKWHKSKMHSANCNTNLNGFNFFLKEHFLKFIYSEKATKFCEISTVDLTITTLDKSTVDISQNFVAFSEYMNFNRALN